MSKKIFLQEGEHHTFVRKQDLHAERPVDVKPLQKTVPERLPRNPNTHISIRLPMDLCDWIWEQYPNEPTISSAVQQYLKDKYYGLSPETRTI